MEVSTSAYEKSIGRLQDIYEPLALEDDFPQAGRKLFALHFAAFLSHLELSDTDSALSILVEAGRRAVYVASNFPILEADKRVSAALSTLRKSIAAAQDILIYRQILLHPNLNDIPQTDDEEVSPLQAVRGRVENRAAKAEKQLISLLESAELTGAVKRLTKAIKRADGDPGTSLSQYEVRHGAPILLHTALADVRRFDAAVAGGNLAELVRLYESFLRLGDMIGYFRPLLGSSVSDFEDRCQALLEALHPIVHNQFAQENLKPSKKMDDGIREALSEFLAQLHQEAEDAAAAVPDQWASFNTRTNLRKFSDALLVLR